MQALGISLVGLIAYAINFLVLVVLLRLLLYKPVKDVLDKRKLRIAEGLEAAERASEEASEQRKKFEGELEEARGKARIEAAKLAEQVEKVRNDVLQSAEKEAAAIKDRIMKEIAQERQQAEAALEQQTVELALAISKKVVGEALDQDSQRLLVARFLNEMKDESKQ